MTLQTNFYFLSPVEVVKVTPKNLEEVAAWCGGKVAEAESRRVEGRMDKYVWVPTPKGTAISWAFPGMFITKRVVITEKDDIKITYSVFRKDYFNKNFFRDHLEALDKTWERQAREAGKKPSKPNPPVHITVEVNGVELTKPEIELPKTEVNGQASMIAQRDAIRETTVEAAAGDPHRP